MEIDSLFDAAAEALILVDPNDAESVVALNRCFVAVRSHFGDTDDPKHPANVAIECVARLAQGDTSALKPLEKAYSSARNLALAEVPVAEETAMPLAGDAELLADFGVRASEHLDDADDQLLALEAHPRDAEAIDAVFRAFHTIKGMAGFLGLDTISERAHASESLLADARKGDAEVVETTVVELFAAVDHLRSLVFSATGVGEARVAGGDDVVPEPVAGEPWEPATKARTLTGREDTVRVDERRLDGLLDTIGEMVIAESMVSAALRNGVDESVLAGQLDRLDKISRELQQMATALRMVPLRSTFKRMSRLVRDVAHKAGKPVEFIVSGEDTELDKEVVDRISDPLIHALRNAVDHGIESAEARTVAGKPAAGRIELRAYHAGGAIHIEVSDDGAGLDSERIFSKACERGLVAADAVMDEAAIAGLIFRPGFSTAQKVTDVSGRGVGMDVVRRTVDELRGRIEMDSKPGEGTTLSIKLPITLAIIDGMVVRLGDERYVIPMIAIERSVRPEAGDITCVQGRGEMLNTADGLVPILRLHRLFATSGAIEDPTEGVVVITSEGASRCGFLVCELLGQQQTVIKPLGEGLPVQQGITGGAIMADGRVGLILDTEGLIRLSHGDFAQATK